jgi:two-component system invasion response regulator UvrY
MKKSIRVALVDDHIVVRKGIANLLKKEAGIKIVFDVSNGQELLMELKQHEIDVVLLDIKMPIMDGKQTLKALKINFPDVLVIMLSMFQEEAITAEYLSLGASGFLAKNCSIDETVDAIFNVHFEGKQHVSKAEFFSQSDENAKSEIELDEREKIVLSLICEGKTSDEIAKEINRSKKLVDLMRTKLIQKFEASNAIDLVRKSILMGYYSPKEEL